MYKPVVTMAMVALLSTSGSLPVAAQTRPLPGGGPQTLPAPPETPSTRPTPLPGGPQIQPPRPVNPGGPQIQPPRPNPGGPQIQPPRPGYPGGPQIQPPTYPGAGYGQTLRCESRNNRRQRCAANTDNRVQLIRRLGGVCTQGRSWGYDQRSIWVDRGCRAEFSYGAWGGGHRPQPGHDNGPSAGAVIAGVVVVGSLMAILANSANKQNTTGTGTGTGTGVPAPQPPPVFPAGPPAALVADLSPLPSAARPSVQTCLFEASRQIGATGGTRLSYDRLVSLEPGNGGWRFAASLTASYPDGDRVLPLYCRATPTEVIQLDFTNGQ